MTSNKSKARFPQPAASDWGLTIGKAGLKAGISAISGIGGGAVEVLCAVVALPLAKRREQWLEDVATRLLDVEQKVDGFRIAELSKNEAFITAISHASIAAIKNHQKEKLEALCNAVLNSALPNPPEVDVQLIFLGLVDSLTPLHLRILLLLNEPSSWGDWNEPKQPLGTTGGVSNVIESAFPDLRGQKYLYEKVVKDLQNDGLIGVPMSYSTTGRMVFAPTTAPLGRRFLTFITLPGVLRSTSKI